MHKNLTLNAFNLFFRNIHKAQNEHVSIAWDVLVSIGAIVICLEIRFARNGTNGRFHQSLL